MWGCTVEVGEEREKEREEAGVGEGGKGRERGREGKQQWLNDLSK